MFNFFCQSVKVPISVGAVVAVLVITAAVGVAIGVVFALWKGNRKGRTDPTFQWITTNIQSYSSLFFQGSDQEKTLAAAQLQLQTQAML